VSTSATSALVPTAATAAAVIPFHCVICFEEFNFDTRYPVVLPCGHTYVCFLCCTRLNRCMECRTPLFIYTANLTTGQGNTSTSNGCGGSTNLRGPPLYPQHSRHHHQAPSSPHSHAYANIHPPQQQDCSIALPLPKNIVLISMMEAAGCQASVQKEPEHDTSKRCSHKYDQENDAGKETKETEGEEDDDDEDEFDVNRIIMGMMTIAGSCGSYVVRDPQGLIVLPNHPKEATTTMPYHRENNESSSSSSSELQGVACQESTIGTETQERSEEDDNRSEEDDNNSLIHDDQDDQHDPSDYDTRLHKPLPIMFGQTVQVVSFKDGVAKLARGSGYICANSSQLVKGLSTCSKGCTISFQFIDRLTPLLSCRISTLCL